MTNMKTKAEIETWAKKTRPHRPYIVTRAFIQAVIYALRQRDAQTGDEQ